MKLQDRIALVTGASSGIGRAVAIHLARHGAEVAVNYPVAAGAGAAAAVVREIEAAGGRAWSVCADVRAEPEVAAMVAEVKRRSGRIDILVNNAGIVRNALITDMPLDVWDEVMNVNLRGAFLCIKHALPDMLQRNYGRIINTASGLAFKGRPMGAAYCASKAGLLGLMRTAVLEIGQRNVAVNCVAPTVTWTPINAATQSAERLEEIRRSIPKGRAGEIEDLLPAYLFLASAESDYFTGQCLSPNGGNVMA
ncbi:MAG: SDR family oxidoreductase [Burkholderiaceae bacterium]|nr:SDR family oxidoreductase [Burkholderiaceae bacterium]